MSKCVATPSCWLMIVWPGAVMWHNEHQVSRDVTRCHANTDQLTLTTHTQPHTFEDVGFYHNFPWSFHVSSSLFPGWMFYKLDITAPICTYLSLSRPVYTWLLGRLWPPCGDLASDILSQWTDRLSCLTKWTQMIINLTQIFHISSIKYCQVSPQHNL